MSVSLSGIDDRVPLGQLMLYAVLLFNEILKTASSDN
jgi:hypothetical protein